MYSLTYERLPLYVPLPPPTPPPGLESPGLEEKVERREVIIIDISGNHDDGPRRNKRVIEWEI